MTVRGRPSVLLAAGLCLAMLGSCGDEPPATSPEIRAPVFSPLPGTNTFALVVPRGTDKDSFPELAREHCGDRVPCAVYAWVAPDAPARTMPVSEREAMTQAFSYLSNRASGFELSLWNCLMYVRADRAECMPDLQDGQ